MLSKGNYICRRQNFEKSHLPTRFYSLPIPLDNKSTEFFGLGGTLKRVIICPCQYKVPVGFPAIGDPHFAAVQDVFIPLLDGSGRYAGHVRSCDGFRHAVRLSESHRGDVYNRCRIIVGLLKEITKNCRRVSSPNTIQLNFMFSLDTHGKSCIAC